MHRHISYWLMPSDAHEREFRAIIDRLAATYAAQTFGPHVTLHSGPGEEVRAEAILSEAVEGVGPIKLSIRGVDHGPAFFKTLFVTFDASDELNRLAAALRRLSPPAEYDLQPHLSLVYQDLDPPTRYHLAEKIPIGRTEITFDRVRAVSTPASLEEARDLALWREVAQGALRTR